MYSEYEVGRESLLLDIQFVCSGDTLSPNLNLGTFFYEEVKQHKHKTTAAKHGATINITPTSSHIHSKEYSWTMQISYHGPGRDQERAIHTFFFSVTMSFFPLNKCK